jgi:hypothetical protein
MRTYLRTKTQMTIPPPRRTNKSEIRNQKSESYSLGLHLCNVIFRPAGKRDYFGLEIYLFLVSCFLVLVIFKNSFHLHLGHSFREWVY